MTFDPKKPVKTRDGKRATIIKCDLRGDRQIVAVIDAPNGSQVVMTYATNGSRCIFQDDALDLINEPERETFWMNVYPKGVLHPTGVCSRAVCERGATFDRVGLVSLTFECGKLVAFENHDIAEA